MKGKGTIKGIAFGFGMVLMGMLLVACAAAELPPGAARATFVVR